MVAKPPKNKEIGERLREFSLTKFDKLTDFAASLDLNLQQLSAYVRGLNMPGKEILTKLSDEGCNINWLLTGEGSMLRGSEPGTRAGKTQTSLKSQTLKKMTAAETAKAGAPESFAMHPDRAELIRRFHVLNDHTVMVVTQAGERVLYTTVEKEE